MKRYYFDSDGNSIVVNDFTVPLNDIDYDDIVDRSSFVPSAENVRKAVISGQGLGKKGVYDKTRPSDFILALRSGKLDKAEVSDYIRENSSKVLKDADEAIENLKTSDSKTKTTTDIND